MAIITKIEPQKKDKNKVNIYLDDVFYHGLHNDLVVKYSIQEEQEVEIEWLNNIVIESEKITAFNKALNYMGEAFKTQKQIYDYLKKKEYKSETISYVIEKLKEYKYLDDEKYCEWYIRTHRNKYGKSMLKSKLFEKGINKNIIVNTLSEFESNEDEIIILLHKKLDNKTITPQLLSKTYRFMAGRGFGYEEVKRGINKIIQIEVEDYDGGY